ncbi:hypothetical protein GCM10009619_42300 [Williamsia maris]
MELFRAPYDEQQLHDLAAERGHIDRFTMSTAMRPLMSRGWIVASNQERSTCAGPSFYASTAGAIRVRNRNQVGELVAHSVGKFRSMHGRRPHLRDLVLETRTRNGQNVFRDVSDAEAQARWLVCAGWITIEDDGAIKRGPRARKFSEDRRAARIAARAATTGWGER